MSTDITDDIDVVETVECPECGEVVSKDGYSYINGMCFDCCDEWEDDMGLGL